MSFRTHLDSLRPALVSGFAGLVLATLCSFLFPLQYASTVRVLITQPNATGLDPYTAVKSTERIASSLSELIGTTSFYDHVIQTEGVDQSYYTGLDEHARRERWQKTIVSSIAPGTGILTLAAYHEQRTQARLLVDASARELANEAPGFFGTNVKVQVIDAPLDSRWIARPDFLKNGFYGLVVGLFLGFGWMAWKHGRSFAF